MHLMLDLETLDTEPTSVVLSIGAVLFDQTGIKSEFYVDMNFESQLLAKRTQSQSTMNWWLNQQSGRKFNLPVTPYGDQLMEFLLWLNPRVNIDKEFRIWGNGSGFDVSILEHLLKSKNQPVPWYYFQIRDLRTFKEYVANNEPIREGAKEASHNALEDAKDQAYYVIRNMKWPQPVEILP